MCENPRLLAIYDADGTWSGELRYLLSKLGGGESCALCDISHGWNPLGKTAWRYQRKAEPGLSWIHRDELPARLQKDLAHQLPCVAVECGTDVKVIISKTALSDCRGDYRTFERLLEEALRALAQELAPATLNETLD
jgi:hypothetical protein